MREKALGSDHPDVTHSLNSLAGLYHSQGRDAEAEAVIRHALVIAGGRFRSTGAPQWQCQ
jgi:hypothetical protein